MAMIRIGLPGSSVDQQRITHSDAEAGEHKRYWLSVNEKEGALAEGGIATPVAKSP